MRYYVNVRGRILPAWLLGVVTFAWCLVVLPEAARGADLVAASPHADAWKDFQYQEASNCALCHAGPTAANRGLGALDLVVMAEYTIWKTHDKHAQAYAVLEGKRGQQMAK